MSGPSPLGKPTPPKSCQRRLLIVLALLVGAFLFVFYVFPPSSWLIPYHPMVQGSSGMFVFSRPEIEPRWRWLSWRGRIAVPALKEAMREGNPYARRGAARVLGEHKDPSLLPDLEAALVKEGDEIVRYEIAKSIFEVGGPQAFEILARVARGTSTGRYGAIEVLGQSKDVRAGPILLESFKTERSSGRDGLVAARSLDSIYGDRIASQARAWFADGAISWDELSALMRDSEHFDGSVMVPLLAERLRAASNPKERLDYIRDLGYKGGPDAIPVLLESLTPSPDRGSKERREAIEMLLRIGDKKAGPGLLEFAVRSLGDERQKAMRVLGALEEERAVPWLLEMLKEGQGAWTKHEAALALSRILHVDIGLFGNAGYNEVNLARYGPVIQKAAEDYVAAHPSR